MYVILRTEYILLLSHSEISDIVQFFFVDTNPFVKSYWEDTQNNYDWREVAPREKYLTNLLQVCIYAISSIRTLKNLLILIISPTSLNNDV